MFHTGRDCTEACPPLLFLTVKIESNLGKRQTREIRRALELEGINTTFQDNFAVIDKDIRDDSRDDEDLQPFSGQKSLYPW